MIDEENLNELELIVDVYKKLGNTSLMFEISEEAIYDAINQDNIDDNIMYIIKHFPILITTLLSILKAKFPDKLERTQKYLMLI